MNLKPEAMRLHLVSDQFCSQLQYCSINYGQVKLYDLFLFLSAFALNLML